MSVTLIMMLMVPTFATDQSSGKKTKGDERQRHSNRKQKPHKSLAQKKRQRQAKERVLSKQLREKKRASGRDSKLYDQNRVTGEPPRKSLSKSMLDLLPELCNFSDYGEYGDIKFPSSIDFIKIMLIFKGEFLKYLPWWVCQDPEMVRLAVLSYGLALKYADQYLQEDYGTVKLAVQSCGIALKYASNDLKKDFDIALTAVKQNPDALQYVLGDLKNNHLISDQLYRSKGNSNCSMGWYSNTHPTT
jgi:hypothetical protein